MSAESWHGTINGYCNHKCRCNRCRAAWRDYSYDLRLDRRDRLSQDPTLAQHGVYSTYDNWMCRCAPCVSAKHARSRIDNARRRTKL